MALLVNEVNVIYDIMSQEESSWGILAGLSLILLLIWLIVIYKVNWSELSDKLRNAFMASVALSFMICIGYTINENKNQELRYLKTVFEAGEAEILRGNIHYLMTSQDKKSSLDIFTIGDEKIMRVRPNKSAPMRGCWTGFVTEQALLNTRNVIIHFINFPNWSSVPKRLGGGRVDNLCILRMEIK